MSWVLRLLGAASILVLAMGFRSVRAEPFQSQFRLPPKAGDAKSPAFDLPRRLTYQYGYGSESDTTYLGNPDLDRRVRDDFLSFDPEWHGEITYRPTDWLETTLGVIIEREFPIIEEKRLRLPDGEIVVARKRQTILRADLAAFKIVNVVQPFEFSIGRQKVEDNRHWLYDVPMDVFSISRRGLLQVDLSIGRERLFDLETSHDPRDRINTGILYLGYRGIEDHHLAGYTIFRHDRTKNPGTTGRPLTRPLSPGVPAPTLITSEGERQFVGLRSSGMPTPNFRYWMELASLVGGRDELSRPFDGYALDIGGIYLAEGILGRPYVILGFAYATGDDPKDPKNNEFRQTGLQSNETRLGGIPDMKIYGEVLDPELSNLRIITAGLTFRTSPDFSVDIIYHRYRLNQVADEVRETPLTALMNENLSQRTRDVGGELDVGIGIRSLFGLKRLGVDIRAGLFFPGPAFQSPQNLGAPPIFRSQENFIPADKGMALITKFWW